MEPNAQFTPAYTCFGASVHPTFLNRAANMVAAYFDRDPLEQLELMRKSIESYLSDGVDVAEALGSVLVQAIEDDL